MEKKNETILGSCGRGDSVSKIGHGLVFSFLPAGYSLARLRAHRGLSAASATPF